MLRDIDRPCSLRTLFELPKRVRFCQLYSTITNECITGLIIRSFCMAVYCFYFHAGIMPCWLNFNKLFLLVSSIAIPLQHLLITLSITFHNWVTGCRHGRRVWDEAGRSYSDVSQALSLHLSHITQVISEHGSRVLDPCSKIAQGGLQAWSTSVLARYPRRYQTLHPRHLPSLALQYSKDMVYLPPPPKKGEAKSSTFLNLSHKKTVRTELPAWRKIGTIGLIRQWRLI